MIEALPRDEPGRLNNSPLALVVAQVRFPAILSIQSDDRLLARFQDAIRETYPFLSVGHQVGFSVGPQGIEQQQNSGKIYQFTDVNRQWTVTLSADAVSLEARRYTSYEDFSERIFRVITAAQSIYRIDVRQRVGLRYVNEIRHPEASEAAHWASLINPQLLGLLADDRVVPLLSASYQEASLQLPTGGLTIRHGHFVQGTTVPSIFGDAPKDEGPFYLLDFDAFHESFAALDVHTLNELFQGYNHTMFQLLRWGVQDKLFAYLKGDG